MTLFRGHHVTVMLLAILLLSVTFTYPRLKLERPTYRYVFVFDISQSMNVKDVPGTGQSITRLEHAKKTILETLSVLPCGTEAGLALFTGHRAFLLITPIEICANHRELSAMLNNIDWRMTWKRSSEIAKGIFKSITLLKQLDDNTRLVFISDGHESPPVNPELPPRFTSEIGDVRGMIIGVGGDSLVPIPKFDIKTGEQEGYWKADEVEHTNVYTNTSGGEDANIVGTEHLSSLKEAYLQGLADKTGLIYHRLGSADDLHDQVVMRSLSNPQTITTDVRWLFALGALLIFISALLIEPVKNLLRSR